MKKEEIEKLEPLKLNLASSDKHLEGFVSVDFRADVAGVDYVHDLSKPLPFKNGSVDEIFCSHFIEHLFLNETKDILKDWFRVLKEGSHIDIWTPDWNKIVSIYTTVPDVNVMEFVNWRVFNKNRTEGDSHHSTYTFHYLSRILKEAGFKTITKLYNDKFPFHPLHKDINLGLRAYKKGSNLELDKVEGWT